MRHGSLFSGIGGFDLAAQWIGWTNVFQVEIEDFPTKVLEKNFPGVRRFKDIKDFDGKQFTGTVDVLSAGFPCQPFSVSGRQKGKEDSRYLWPETARCVREIKPSFFVCENVPGLLAMEDIFEEICVDLEKEGYKVEPFCIPACAVGCWHKRERLWILAYPQSNGSQGRVEQNKSKQDELPEIFSTWDTDGSLHAIEKKLLSKPGRIRDYDGVSRRLVKHGIIAYGNAIVPQVAYEIFKAINECHVR